MESKSNLPCPALAHRVTFGVTSHSPRRITALSLDLPKVQSGASSVRGLGARGSGTPGARLIPRFTPSRLSRDSNKSAEKRARAPRQSSPRAASCAPSFCGLTGPLPSRQTALKRTPHSCCGPKRRPTSACRPHWPSFMNAPVSCVSGLLPARLGTRLTAPPTDPLGGMPPSSAEGPLCTSTRSNISGVTR